MIFSLFFFSPPLLGDPEPHLFEEVLGDLLGPYLGIHGSLAGPNVGLFGLDKGRALEQLPEKVQGDDDGDANVVCDEVLDGPVARCEDGETIEDDNDDKVAEGKVGRVGLEAAPEDQRVAVHTLRNQRLAELNVRDADADPGEQVGQGHECLEVGEGGRAAGRNAEVGQERDRRRHGDGVIGDTGPRALEEDLWCLAVLSKGEEVARAGVQEGVGRGRCRGQDDCIDDVGEDRDAGAVDGDDPRGGSGTSTTVEKFVIVAGHGNTDSQGSKNVEEKDTPEDTADGLGDVLPWVLGLTSSNGDHLNTSVRERSVDEGGEETEESSSISNANVLLHGARVLPVTETKTVMARGTTKIDNESDNEKTNNGHNLDASEDELGFTVYRDGENVQANDNNNDDGDPGSLVDTVVPETDDDRCRRNLSTQSEGRVVPVVPTWMLMLGKE